MPITNFAFEELNDGSGTGSIINDQPATATRVFKIAWTDLSGFVFALKGGWTAINSTTWTYALPDQHLDWPQMYCSGVAYEGLGRTSQDPTSKKSSWEFCKITATYTIPTLNIGGGANTIIEEEFDFKVEFAVLPPGTLETVDGDDVTTSQTLRIATLDYTVKMPALPKLPGGNINAVMSLLGRMNNGPFGGAAAGHMLFLGMQATSSGVLSLSTPAIAGSNALDSARTWNVVLRFAYRDEMTWDELHLPTVGKKQVRFKVDESPFYQSGNLNILLPSGT